MSSDHVGISASSVVLFYLAHFKLINPKIVCKTLTCLIATYLVYLCNCFVFFVRQTKFLFDSVSVQVFPKI